jgi:hypothetical protein
MAFSRIGISRHVYILFSVPRLSTCGIEGILSSLSFSWRPKMAHLRILFCAWSLKWVCLSWDRGVVWTNSASGLQFCFRERGIPMDIGPGMMHLTPRRTVLIWDMDVPAHSRFWCNWIIYAFPSRIPIILWKLSNQAERNKVDLILLGMQNYLLGRVTQNVPSSALWTVLPGGALLWRFRHSQGRNVQVRFQADRTCLNGSSFRRWVWSEEGSIRLKWALDPFRQLLRCQRIHLLQGSR